MKILLMAKRKISSLCCLTLATGCLASGLSEICSPPPIGCWPLDEGSGEKATDQSKNRVDGGIQRPEWVQGSALPALELVRFAGWVALPVRAASLYKMEKALTLAAWIKPDRVDLCQAIVANGGPGVSGYTLLIEKGKIGFGANLGKNKNFAAYSPQVLTPGVWSHVAASFEADGNVRLYHNGQEIFKTPSEGKIRYEPVCAGATLHVGRLTYCIANCYGGLIRNVMLFDRALADGEVAKLHQSTRDVASIQGEVYRDRWLKRCNAVVRGSVEDDKGVKTPAIVSIRDEKGRFYGPEKLFYPVRGGFVCTNGEFEVRVPSGRCKVTAMRGPEWRPAETELVARPDAPVQGALRLTPFVDMASKGWAAGEHHYHFRTHGDQIDGVSPTWPEVCAAAKAGGLKYVSYTESPQNPPVNEENFLAREGGFEGRSHMNMGGHYVFMGAREYPRAITWGFREAARLNMAGVFGTGEQWGEAKIFQPGLTLARDMVVAAALGKHAIWDVVRPESNGKDVTSLWFQQAWYRFLNCGFRVAGSGFTDGDLNLPNIQGGFPGTGRTYVKIASLSWKEIEDAYRQGRMMGTNGPLLLLKVNGQDPGAVVRMDKRGQTAVVELETHAQGGVDAVELIQNGQVIKRFEGRGEHQEDRCEIPIEKTCWLAARCCGKSNNFFGVFAHANPVYVQLADEPIKPCAGDVEFFLKWIEDYRRLLSQPEKCTPHFVDVSCFDEVKAGLLEAEKCYKDLPAHPRKWE
ncbi:MAG: CehA/McbA family metallohydrolase [Verrucomicrobiae bacterium]|nr:CehA/McbA family metallohydrolase [Verrucomicrobiae bacterium]